MRTFTSKDDKVFKAIFADPSDPFLLQTLLSLILKKKVNHISFSNTELLKRNVLERAKLVDFLAEVDGVKTHIEMNATSPLWLHLRNLNFFSTIFSKDTEVGQSYDTQTQFLHIDFTYGIPKSKNIPCMQEYKIQSDTLIPYLENVRIIEFNMDLIKEMWYNVIDETKKQLYHYLSILDTSIEELKEMEKDEFMKRYQEKLEKLNQNIEFTSFLTKEQDIQFQLNTERLEGERHGKKIGEKKSKIEIAKNMLKENCDLSFISKITGLSLDAIEALRK